jgi:hypothetical protein
MLKNITPAQLAGGWVAALAVVMSCSVVAGGAITLGNAELWFMACVVPAGVMWFLCHGKSQLTPAEALSSINTRSTGGRR